MKKPIPLLFALSVLATACGGGLRVESVATSADKPSNVALYVSVRRADKPVTGLTAQSFKINEDGQDLGAEQTQQTLLPRDSVAVHRAALLVDMSGPVTEGDLRNRIAAAAARFVTRAHRTQAVTVYAFDGGANVRQLADFPPGDEEVVEIGELVSYTPQDQSSNLNSAVVEALAQLDGKLMATQKPIRIGSLVVFARGPDLAGRVAEPKMMEVVDHTKTLVFAIGVKDAPGFRASRIGRAGSFEAVSMTALDGAFDEAGSRVADTVNRYYLLSYCSPARAGKRRLRVKVVAPDEKGNELSGSVSTEFDASGFGSGCDPNAKPRFVVHDEGAPAPAPEKPADDEGKKPAQKGSGGEGATGKGAGSDEGDAVVPPPAKPGYAQ